MNKTSKSLLTVLSFIGLAGFTSCNVHEWPELDAETFPFILDMKFEADMPLHKEIYYTRADEESRADQDGHDIRYIVNVYKVAGEDDNNREVYSQWVFSREYADNHDYSVTLPLPEGKYRFRIWSDHVATGTQSDLYYSTSDFTEIKINEDGGHPGNNEMRDAFRGNVYGEVYDPQLYEYRNGVAPANRVEATMQRPMGRYEFISTDMDEFLDKAAGNIEAAKLEAFYSNLGTRDDSRGESFWNGLTRDDVAQLVGLDDYKVVFSYKAFMPSSYNLYTDRPSDSSTGVSYEGKMSVGDEGMQMGFDYVLTNDETTMNLNMQIYNGNGDLVASTGGVEVPVARSKNTVVKGAFLTVTSGGGVTINPDFDGDDYNIEIK